MNAYRLELLSFKIREMRRKYSRELVKLDRDSLELEDLFSLVGELEAMYDHVQRTVAAGDGDMYCLLGKHAPYARRLLTELGEPLSEFYEIIALITDGKIVPCQACKEDASEDN